VCVAQFQRYLAVAIERELVQNRDDQLQNLQFAVDVLRPGLVVERRPTDAENLALPTDRQLVFLGVYSFGS